MVNEESWVLEKYLNKLYRFEIESRFFNKTEQKDFKGVIVGLQPNGKLAIKNKKGELMLFDLNEVQLLD